MEKDKRKIIAGVGVIGGVALLYRLITRARAAPPPPPPPSEEPIAKGTINGYEVWLVDIKPEILRDLQYHEFQAPTSVHVYFEVWKPPYTEEIWITDESQMPVATLALTRPDGVVAKDTRRIPQINSGGDYSLSVSAPIPGVYYADFCGITFSFKLLPIKNETFYPTGLELIYDSAPYCQELLDRRPTILTDPDLRDHAQNLLAIINRKVNINITSIDFKVGPFFPADDSEAAKYDLTIAGDVKNSRSPDVPQAKIVWRVRLIPTDLYAQAYIAQPSSYYNPKYWTYPDPDYKTLFAPYSGTSLYYDNAYGGSFVIVSGSTGPFTRRALGRWRRMVKGLRVDKTLEELRKYLNHGDRYEVVIITGVGLQPTASGYGYHAYPLKHWHVGYVIID